MKKISLSLLALCFALTATAEPIGKQAARYTAQSYMLVRGKQLSSAKPSQMKASGYTTAGDENEQPYYYVFNAGGDGGYVIVSGDDRVEPILGYVDQGTFDPENIPENMRSWLQLYADQIKYIVDNDIQPGDPRIKTRNKVAATKHSIPELLKSRWNQGHPYNLTCPKYYKGDGTQHYSASGCAATAMAQVINFYKYPAKLKSAIPSHSRTYTLDDNTTKTVTAKGVPKNTPIDWENMRDTYSCNDDHVHDAPDTAVANLMLYCGQSIKMGWGGSSGADTSKSRDALVTYFGFDSRAIWASRPDYSIDEWFDMLYDEMEAGYPVLYRGHSSGGGHAFVIDGFDGDNLFHVNWGWGGGSNGWFLISILNPGDNSGMGASSSSDGYSMTQGGCFNLRIPNTPKEDGYLSISDITIVGTSIRAKFTNRTGSSAIFHTGIVRLNDNGEYELVGTKMATPTMTNGSSQTKTFPIAGKLPEGTYRLSPASKSSKSDVWRAEFDLQKQYIEAVVNAAGEVDLNLSYPTTESISIDTIVFPGTRIAGQQQEVKVTFRNNGKEYFKTIYLFASKTSTKTYTESKSMVAIRSGETVDVSYFFKPEQTGTYNLWFCTDDKGNGVMGQGTVEIISEAEATQANLAVTEYKISNKVNNVVVGKRFIGKATIENKTTNDFHGQVKFQLWHQKIGSNTATSGPTRSFAVDIPAGQTATVDFDFDNLSEGYYYRFKVMYGNQNGTLGNGGLWDNRWEMKAGALTWTANGAVGGKAYASTIAAGTNTAGFYADCNRITRLTPNSNNVNTIYALAPGMAIPRTVTSHNVAVGSHAEHINLVNGLPYYIPVSFDADSASFTYTFADTEDGTKWHAFTMPFNPDSILLDEVPVTLDDTLKHFWIYEFKAEGNNGEVIFEQATQLRGGTPYIIAADAKMAGRSLVFRATNVSFFKTGSDKMLVTSPSFKFHGNTYSPKVENCYLLNEEGTAFEYTSTEQVLDAMASYFTTVLPEGQAPTSIVLPDIPVSPDKETTLDEMAAAAVEAGTFTQLTLKRTFDAGLNTICLPFQVDDVTAIFGQDAQAFGFYDLVGNELNFLKADKLTAGKPYIIILSEAITDDIVLNNIAIDEASTEAGCVAQYNATFCGTYSPIAAGQWPSIYDADVVYTLNADGTVAKVSDGTGINGFRAYFDLMEEVEGLTINLYDDATGIASAANGFSDRPANIYNLAGQRLSKMQKGINIVKGKVVLK